MTIIVQDFADLRAAGNQAAALSAPVLSAPPVSLADARVPSCPSCGEGTVFLHACGTCGSTGGAADYCCGQSMLVRGAYVSTLTGQHSWLGCPLMAAVTTLAAEITVGWGEDTDCTSCLCPLPAGAPAWLDSDGRPSCADCAAEVARIAYDKEAALTGTG